MHAPRVPSLIQWAQFRTSGVAVEIYAPVPLLYRWTILGGFMVKGAQLSLYHARSSCLLAGALGLSYIVLEKS